MAQNRRIPTGMILATGILVIGGGVLLNAWASDWRWEHYPVHGAVEALGAFAALTLAAVMWMLRAYRRSAVENVWAASALTGMGMLDGAHALTYAGHSFVWLHSVAALTGGVLFACVWFPESVASRRAVQRLPWVTLAAASAVGIPKRSR